MLLVVYLFLVKERKIQYVGCLFSHTKGRIHCSDLGTLKF